MPTPCPEGSGLGTNAYSAREEAAGQRAYEEQDQDAQAAKAQLAADFAATMAKLGSAKQILVEERVASPGPLVSASTPSTRSRAVAATGAASATSRAGTPSLAASPLLNTATAQRAESPARAAATGLLPRVKLASAAQQAGSGAPIASAVGEDVSSFAAAPADATGSGNKDVSGSRRPQQVRMEMMVPRAKMGLLIGAQGKTIRELLQDAKTLRAHVHVPMASGEDASSDHGQASSNKSVLVVITGPRNSVAKLKDKVAAIISGQAAVGGRDPLAYIEPYIQGQRPHSGVANGVPEEAKRLLDLIQKLNLAPAPPAAAHAAALDAHDSSASGTLRQDSARATAAGSLCGAEAGNIEPAGSGHGESEVHEGSCADGAKEASQAAGITPHAVEAGTSVSSWRQGRETVGGFGGGIGPMASGASAVSAPNTVPSETRQVDTRTFAHRAPAGVRSLAPRPCAPGTSRQPAVEGSALDTVTAAGYGLWPMTPHGVATQDAPPRASCVAAPHVSELRVKLDHVTQELQTMTRALGRLSLNLPADLEPYPSEVETSLVLRRAGLQSLLDGSAHTPPPESGASSLLIIHSHLCMQHRVAEGAQEHPGRLEALLGFKGVLAQVFAVV